MYQQNTPYVQPPVPTMMPHNSSTAIISLIAGIAGFTILPFLGSVVAVITGHIAKGEIKRGGGMVTGNGMATWGLILGYVALGLGICGCILAITLTLLGVALPFGLSIPYFLSPSSGQ